MESSKYLPLNYKAAIKKIHKNMTSDLDNLFPENQLFLGPQIYFHEEQVFWVF